MSRISHAVGVLVHSRSQAIKILAYKQSQDRMRVVVGVMALAFAKIQQDTPLASQVARTETDSGDATVHTLAVHTGEMQQV